MPVAQVVGKKGSDALGIRNKSKNRWDAISTKGAAKKVAPEEVIPLKDGIVFNTGEESITIKANQE